MDVRIEKLSIKTMERFINYCKRYRNEHDESDLYDEDLEEFPIDNGLQDTYLAILNETVLGVVSLRRLPYLEGKKRGRFSMFHVANDLELDGSAIEKVYHLLWGSIAPHFDGLDHVFLFLPEGKDVPIGIVKRLGFEIQRLTWVLIRDEDPIPSFQIPESLTIHPLPDDITDQEAEDWRRVRNSAFSTLLGSETPITIKEVRDQIAEVSCLRGGMFILYDQDRPIGVVKVMEETEEGEDYAFIGPVAVIPDYQGKGMGKILVRKALEYGKSLGLEKAMLCVNGDNERATALYKKEGFYQKQVMHCYKKVVAPAVTSRLPVLFVGHGSPMNAIEDNSFRRTWESIGKQLIEKKPKVVLAISAHWVTEGTRIQSTIAPRQIYDFYGFPKALYQVKYPVKGDPALADQVIHLLGSQSVVKKDDSWGIDHGTWSVLSAMFPEADVPIVQLSIDGNVTLDEYVMIGSQLSTLRDEGVLIIGSGNVVHSFAYLNFDMEEGYPWAKAFDDAIATFVEKNNHEHVIQYKLIGPEATKAFQTTEHFAPLLYCMGAAMNLTNKDEGGQVTVFNQKCLGGSLSMTSYIFDDHKWTVTK